MRDECLVWDECPVCGMLYTWFRVEIMPGLEMYGWLHKTDGDCKRDTGLDMEWNSDGASDTGL